MPNGWQKSALNRIAYSLLAEHNLRRILKERNAAPFADTRMGSRGSLTQPANWHTTVDVDGA